MTCAFGRYLESGQLSVHVVSEGWGYSLSAPPLPRILYLPFGSPALELPTMSANERHHQQRGPVARDRRALLAYDSVFAVRLLYGGRINLSLVPV